MRIILQSVLLTVTWTDFLSWGIGILGLFFSVFFYLRSKKNRDPIYRCKTTQLIQRNTVSQIGNLEVYFDSIKLDALSITKIVLWNAGKDIISSSDVSDKDKVRIEIDKEYDILSCGVVKQTKEANNFDVEIAGDKKSVVITFDYMDYEEGAVIKLRHTGSSSSNLIVKGSIKAVKSIKRQDSSFVPNPFIYKKLPFLRKTRWVILLCGLFIMIAPTITVLNNHGIFEGDSPVNSFWSFVLTLLFLLLTVYLGACLIREFAQSVDIIPMSLEEEYFNEDF